MSRQSVIIRLSLYVYNEMFYLLIYFQHFLINFYLNEKTKKEISSTKRKKETSYLISSQIQTFFLFILVLILFNFLNTFLLKKTSLCSWGINRYISDFKQAMTIEFLVVTFEEMQITCISFNRSCFNWLTVFREAIISPWVPQLVE